MTLWTPLSTDPRADDVEQIKRVEAEVIRALAPFRENTDPALALFALIRCARMLLRSCPPDSHRQLLPVIRAFLEGQSSPEPESRLFLQ